MITPEIYYYFDSIIGISVDEKEFNVNSFKLFGKDIIFWTKGYNNLDNDKDYIFSISGLYQNEMITIDVNENVFLDLMESLDKIYKWKESGYGSSIEKLKNNRIHKLINMMELPD